MRTGLFFGTFNPVHNGHEAVVASYLKSGEIDTLWIIVTPSPPHKDSFTLAPFQDRLNMLKLVFDEGRKLHISDVEQRMPPPHYTWKTLSYLKKRYPDYTFILCIGGDTLQTMDSWYNYEQIADMAELLVAERPGIPQDVPQGLRKFCFSYCSHDKTDISSTEIRRMISSGEMPGPGQLHPDVIQYIRKNRLYRPELLKKSNRDQEIPKSKGCKSGDVE